MHAQDGIRRIRRQADRLRTLDVVDARTPAFARWFQETSAAIAEIFGPGPGPAREFQRTIFEPLSPSKYDPDSDWRRAYEKGVPIALSFFDSITRDLTENPSRLAGSAKPAAPQPVERPVKRAESLGEALVLPGGDERTGGELARFLAALGVTASVVAEPGPGQCAVERLERSAAVFAIVLLEPGLRGGAARKGKSSAAAMRPAPARMFELGFLLGRFGASKVCAVLPDGVELPFNFPGLSIPLDAGGKWRVALAGAMKDSGLPVDLDLVR